MAVRKRASARVLAIFPGALGDLICLVPALREIARRHPGAPVDLMAREELARFTVGRIAPARGAAASSPVCARGHSIDRREVASLFAESETPTPEARAFFGGFAHIYSFFAHDHAGYRRALEAAAPNAQIRFLPFRPEGEGHVAQGYLKALGAPKAPLDARVEVHTEELAQARQILARAAIRADDFALIHPGSGSPRKNWPLECFVEMAQRLAQSIQVAIVLGPAETATERMFKNVGTTLTNPSLGELAGLARLCRLYIGNDSGVSHLCAAAGARGVAIFGPTDPARWHPLGDISVIRREPLEDLTLDEVARAVAPML